MKPITVLSLFDGISCGQLALRNIKVPVKTYFASEIDFNAIKITNKNFPNTIHLGDVTKINFDRLPKIDLLIGGSPCQGFSFSGKMLNFNDPRSKLFFEFVKALKILRRKNPNIKFMLENVKMKKEFEAIISQHLKVQPVFIDAKEISCIRRPRLYWTNFKVAPVKPKSIFPIDVLDKPLYEIKSKSYTLGQNWFNKCNKVINVKHEKLPCLTFESGNDFKKWITIPIKWNQSRLITLEEMEKAMGFPVGYTSLHGLDIKHSASHIGNGWHIKVIEHIFKSLYPHAK